MVGGGDEGGMNTVAVSVLMGVPIVRNRGSPMIRCSQTKHDHMNVLELSVLVVLAVVVEPVPASSY